MSVNKIKVNNAKILQIDSELANTENLVQNKAVYKEFNTYFQNNSELPGPQIDYGYYSLDVSFMNFHKYGCFFQHNVYEGHIYIDFHVMNRLTLETIETVRKTPLTGDTQCYITSEELETDFNSSDANNYVIFIQNVYGESSDRQYALCNFSTSISEGAIPGLEYTLSTLSINQLNWEFPFFISYKSNIETLRNDIVEVKQDIQEINERIDDIAPDPSYSSLQELITNVRNVKLLPQTYLITQPLTIPNGTKISGVQGKTIIKLSGNANHCINILTESEDIMIDNVTFDGNSTALGFTYTDIDDIRQRTNAGTKVGIYMNGNIKYIHIRNCVFKNFDLAGIQMYRTHYKFGRNPKITDCEFNDSYYGLLCDVRSEYYTVQGCTCYKNIIGCFVDGGNSMFNCCRFEDNKIGFVCTGYSHDNSTHGIVTGSSFNHNDAYSIAAIDVDQGFTFSGCQDWGSTILICNSRGFSYTGGIIDAEIKNINPMSGASNMIHSCILNDSFHNLGINDQTNLSLKNNYLMNGGDSSAFNNNY